MITMKYFFQVEFKAFVEIPDKEFEFILECCKHHYDFTVASSVEVGGFLYGLKNRREFSNGEDKVCDLTFRQIDLILKSIEMYDNEEERNVHRNMFKIIRQMGEENMEMNKNLQNV